jgi:hypothetical protein
MITKATINLNGMSAKIACRPEFAAQRSIPKFGTLYQVLKDTKNCIHSA